MKKISARILAFILAFAMTFSVATVMTPEKQASAAAVALTATSKTVVLGTTYTITLKDSTNVTKKSFKSSNTKVATVNGKGIVTPVAVGTATIKCTTTLKSGATVGLNCKITVKKRVAATKMEFKNLVHDKMNAHIIEEGSKYDFNMKMTPTSSTDNAYFTIVDSDIASVNAYGIVTAKKAGITTLEVRAGLTATSAKSSKVIAKTYIYVTPKTVVTPTPTPTPTPVVAAKVEKVTMASSQEVQIEFNSPIEKSSIIDKNGDLISGAITIVAGSGASSYGNLTAKLSEDKKTVYINATSEFNGTYVITIFNKVTTTDGQLVAAASFQKDFKDTIGPNYVNSQIKENGYICQINFNEAIDISNFQVISVSGTTNQLVKSRLSQASNYILSPDKKSLSIDLSSCGEKLVNAMVTMIGIKDIKGNSSVQYQLSAVVKCDATEKPAANIVSVVRESKTALTVTFDQAMQYSGFAIVDGNYLNGVVDSDNSKVVRFTLSNTSITGTKSVTFTGYLNYNMASSTANSQTRNVNFTLDTTPPVIANYEFKTEVVNGTNVDSLELTYNKNISIINVSGTVSALVNSTNYDIYTKDITYTGTVNGKKLTLSFAGQTLDAGYYTFTLPVGLVMDELENTSESKKISVNKQIGSSSKLPQPIAVEQDLTNPSKIKVTFPAKLDKVSAETPSNYRLNGAIAPASATIISQTANNAVVELNFAPNSISESTTYSIVISGVKGYNGTYGEMDVYNDYRALVNNNCAVVQSCKLISPSSIQLTLSKDITGTGSFKIATGTGQTVDSSYVFANGNIIYISLPVEITTSTYMTINENNFKDANNNPAVIQSSISVQKAY